MSKTNLRDLPKDLLLMIMTKLCVKTQIEDMIKENKFSELYKNMKAMNEILEKGNKNHLIEFKELGVWIEGEMSGSSASIEINYKLDANFINLFYINIEDEGQEVNFRDYKYDEYILRRIDYATMDEFRDDVINKVKKRIGLKDSYIWSSIKLKDEDIQKIFQAFINCLDHYLLYFKVY